MNMYHISYGFREPYQVLVDSELCKTAVSQKTDFAAQLAIVLQGAVKPMITQCCIHELYLQGKAQQPAVDLAKMFERRKCNHKVVIPGDDCVLSVTGDANKHRYVIATQSHGLRTKLRSIPGTPILHINRSVMVLEPPSEATMRAKALMEAKALAPSTSEAVKLRTEEPEFVRKARRGPKGPNPLSVKKKKALPAQTPKKPSSTSDNADMVKVGDKRKRDEQEDGVTRSAQPVDGDQKVMGHKRKRRRKSSRTQETASTFT